MGFVQNFNGAHGAGQVFQALIMFAIFVLAFFIRLFSVVRYESIIHEFDPWFNFRSTKYLVEEGYYNFHNWFDPLVWYPLGRFVGGTVYPGIMYTADIVHTLSVLLTLPVDIRNVCVFMAPLFAGFTCIVTYLFVKAAFGDEPNDTTAVHNNPLLLSSAAAAAKRSRILADGSQNSQAAMDGSYGAGFSSLTGGSAGITAACMMAIAPGYIARSVAGSYDNECVAIFALVNVFYFYLLAIKQGSLLFGSLTAVMYYYMVTTWGGYIFIINLIPAHILACFVLGLYTERLYVAYSSFYLLGTLMSMQIPFVSFIPVSSPEHLLSFLVFMLLQGHLLFTFIWNNLSVKSREQLLHFCLIAATGGFFFVLLIVALGIFPALTGRLLSLLGSSSNIAIVKSVSEHQPSTWTSFFFDMHACIFFAPVGMYVAFRRLTPQSVFAILYLIFASYFASVMVRLILVLTPAVVAMAGLGASAVISAAMDVLVAPRLLKNSKHNISNGSGSAATSTSSMAAATGKAEKGGETKEGEQGTIAFFGSKATALSIILSLSILFVMFVIHCSWATSYMYSSPAVVLQSRLACFCFSLFLSLFLGSS